MRLQKLWIVNLMLPLAAGIIIHKRFMHERHCRVQLTLSRFEEVSGVDWIDAPGSVVLFVNITNNDTEPVWFKEKVQTESGGAWSEPESVRWLSGGPTWPGDNVECVAAVVPSNAEAVRLFVDCRHPTSYDRIINYLNTRNLSGLLLVLRRWSYWGLSNLGPITGWHSVKYEFRVPPRPPLAGAGQPHS